MSESVIISWFIIGSLVLLRQTISDYRKMRVDSRYSYLMFGATFMLIPVLDTGVLFILVWGLSLALIGTFLFAKGWMGLGDVEALRWIIFGYGIIDYVVVAWFMVAFSLVTLLMASAKKLMKIEGKTPHFGAILATFVLLGVLFGVYRYI